MAVAEGKERITVTLPSEVLAKMNDEIEALNEAAGEKVWNPSKFVSMCVRSRVERKAEKRA